MKRSALLLFFIGFTTLLFAQYNITIEATIFDKVTKQPIPFVNIEFIDKDIKAVSDKDGKFTLRYDEDFIDKKDLLEFASLGYKKEDVEASQFYRFLRNTNKIYLVPETFVESSSKRVKVSSSQIDLNVTGNIYGRVMSESGPIQGATVRVKNSFTEAQTDVDGNFRIDAGEDDVLVAEFLGMKPLEILVTNNNEFDLLLESDGELLDEVTLQGEATKEELIDLGYNGKKKFDAIGYSVNVIKEKDIKSQYYNFGDLITGKFASTNPIITRNGSIFYKSGFIYDIDGMIFSGTDIPYIWPQNIESVSVITSLAGTHKYGTLGRGGVVVIKTKTFSGARQKTASSKSALILARNDYKENIPFIDNVLKKPAYLLVLERTTSFEEAKKKYKALKNSQIQRGVSYFLNVSDYFLKWDKEYALSILSAITKVAYDNPKALKTLAFKLEEQGNLVEARQIYQRIAVLRPNESQSYRDLALIYKETGSYREAMNLYKRMLSNSIKGVDFKGLNQTIANEFSHLLKLHRNKVDYRNIPTDYLSANFKIDNRIVIEWNDPNAEFELQFVNPKKKFYKWTHTKLENKEQMLDEIKNGYTTQEYILNSSKPGEWMINIESLKEEPALNPTYLKYTVYKNYGTPNETREIKVINLNDCKPKATFDKLASN